MLAREVNELRIKNYLPLYDGKSKQEIEAILFQSILDILHKKYGTQPDQAIEKRVRQEWHAMEVNENTLDVAVLHELCLWMRQEGYAYWLNGYAGSSFILYLLGVTAANPLPAHCLCPQCRSVKWNTQYKSGFDLPQSFTVCAVDGSAMEADGQDIPWQNLWGYASKPSSLDIRIEAKLREPLYCFLEKHWLCKLYPESAPYVPYHKHPSLFRFSHITFDALTDKEAAIQDFYKIKIDASCVTAALKNWKNLVGAETDMLEAVEPPKSFADLVSLYGLLHIAGIRESDRIWMERHSCCPLDMIVFTDDVYQYLLDHGFLEKDAWAGAQRVKSGKGLLPLQKDMNASEDRRILEQLEAVRYLFPKAHAVEHVIFLLKTGYAFHSDNSG